MGRSLLTDDPIIKVTFKNCEKGEIYIRKSFRSEWDELVNNLKKKYGERLGNIKLAPKVER